MYASLDYVKRIIPGTSTSFVVPGPWVYNGAIIDLDFENGRYWEDPSFDVVPTDFLSISRASTGYAKTAAGTLTQFAANELRITTLGLLVEDAQTNYILQSQTLETSWTASNTNVTADQAAAPDGTTTMDKIDDGTATGVRHIVTQQRNYGAAGDTISFSFFVKDIDRRYVMLYAFGTPTPSNIYAVFDLQTATVTQSGVSRVGDSASFASAAIESFGNSIYRISMVGCPGTTNTGAYFSLALSDTGTPTLDSAGDRIYDGSNKGVYAWGAQVESAAFPSSYIPTTTAAATRAADVVTNIGGLSTSIATGTGSIVAQTDRGEVSSVAANIVDSNGTNLLGFDATNHGLASITATLATGNTANRTAQDKLGIAWDASGRSLVLNGGTVVTDATAQTPSATQHLGSNGSVNFAYAYIERLTVWTSKLADAILQTTTAP